MHIHFYVQCWTFWKQIVPLFCSVAVPPFRVKELNKEVVDQLARDKIGNGTAQITDAWIMHKWERNRKVLGQLVKKMMEAPNLVVDKDQFMILGGNHTFASNQEVIVKNVKPPKNFFSLRCVIFPYFDENDDEELQQANDVSRVWSRFQIEFKLNLEL